MEKDPHHRHLASAPLHSASGLRKQTGSNPGTAPQADSTSEVAATFTAVHLMPSAGLVPVLCSVFSCW